MQREQRLSEAEIERRLPVWIALTALFLDTELMDYDLHHIVRVTRQAGYSPAETQSILEREVAPVFVWNLFAVVGEWQPWPDAFVEAKMRERMGRVHARSWLAEKLAERLLREDLQRLHACLATEPE